MQGALDSLLPLRADAPAGLETGAGVLLAVSAAGFRRGCDFWLDGRFRPGCGDGHLASLQVRRLIMLPLAVARSRSRGDRYPRQAAGLRRLGRPPSPGWLAEHRWLAARAGRAVSRPRVSQPGVSQPGRR